MSRDLSRDTALATLRTAATALKARAESIDSEAKRYAQLRMKDLADLAEKRWAAAMSDWGACNRIVEALERGETWPA